MMPTLTEGQRRVTRTHAGPGVFVSPATRARQYAAAESLGRRLGSMGADFADIALRTDAIARRQQFDAATNEYEQFYREHLEKQRSDPDFKNWARKWDAEHDRKSAQLLGRIDSPGARTDATEWLTLQKQKRGLSIATAGADRQAAEARSQIPQHIADTIENAISVSPGSQQLLRAGLKQWLQQHHENGVIFSGEVDKWLADFDQGLEPARQAKIYSNALDTLQEAPDRATAEQFIDRVLAPAGMSREQRNDLHAIVKRRFDIEEAQAKTKLDAQRDKDRQAILDKFIAGDFSDIENVINQTSLEPDEKTAKINQAHAWAQRVNSGKDIESDKREEARLEKLALDVSTGAVSLKEFTDQALTAAYGDKPTIDSQAFDSLMGIANREHQSYQAEALKEAIDFAQTQLISVSTVEQMAELYEPDRDPEVMIARFKQLRQFEQDNLAQYRRAMNQWFEAEKRAEREPSDDEIYAKSRKLLSLYKGRKPAELTPQRLLEPQNVPLGRTLGLEEIWGQLDEEGRKAAVRLLSQGATPYQLISHYRLRAMAAE